jgi:hypothetical protein
MNNNRKEYLIKNRDKILKQQKEYRLKNKKKLLQQMKEYKIKNKEYIREYNKKYKIEKKEEIKNYNKQYRNKNPDIIKKCKKRFKEKYRLAENLRQRIRKALKNKTKFNKSMDLIGCDIITLKKHLESQFKNGMNWENYGQFGWHIDHIKPCASFNLIDPEQQKICFHYTNLQPLWWDENIRKKDNIIF